MQQRYDSAHTKQFGVQAHCFCFLRSLVYKHTVFAETVSAHKGQS